VDALTVIVAHNRYRQVGGEERCVALQLAALRAAGVRCALLERDSAALARSAAARALLAGGERGLASAVAAAAAQAGRGRQLVVHAHNLLPALGPRLLESARRLGARTVLQLHNLRLSCSIGIAWRNGRVCQQCRERFTLPAVLHDCRRSLPESVVYAAALARHFRRTLAAVDRFVVPSAYALARVRAIGVPQERVRVVPHYLPPDAFASSSCADTGRYALVAARLVPEKGVEWALRAASAARVPLVIAGAGPERARLAALARELAADVRFSGWASADELRRLRAEAAFVLVPSLVPEFAGYAALEALAAGLPVVAARAGALPELVGDNSCVQPGAVDELAERMALLWGDPARRRAEGERNLARAREHFARERYIDDIRALYGEFAP